MNITTNSEIYNSNMLNMLLLHYLDICSFSVTWEELHLTDRYKESLTENNDSNQFKLKNLELQIFTFSLYNLM